MNLIAQIISVISNPLVLSAPISYALVLKSSSDPAYAFFWTLISMLFVLSIGLFVFWGVKKGMFTNMDISVRTQREPAFIFAGIAAIIYFALILLMNGPRILLATLGALLIGVIITSFINTRTKASMHLAVFSSFSLLMGVMFGGFFWMLPFLAPVVAWSRIKLKRHRLSETIVGTIIGIFLVILVYYVVKYLTIIK